MVENLINVSSYRSWEGDDCEPTDYVDPASLTQFREALERIDNKLKEVEIAADIKRTASCSNDGVDNLVGI